MSKFLDLVTARVREPLTKMAIFDDKPIKVEQNVTEYRNPEHIQYSFKLVYERFGFCRHDDFEGVSLLKEKAQQELNEMVFGEFRSKLFEVRWLINNNELSEAAQKLTDLVEETKGGG